MKIKVNIPSQAVHCKRSLFQSFFSSMIVQQCARACVSDLGLSFSTMQGVEMVNSTLRGRPWVGENLEDVKVVAQRVSGYQQHSYNKHTHSHQHQGSLPQLAKTWTGYHHHNCYCLRCPLWSLCHPALSLECFMCRFFFHVNLLFSLLIRGFCIVTFIQYLLVVRNAAMCSTYCLH